jgi:hypothetical protein
MSRFPKLENLPIIWLENNLKYISKIPSQNISKTIFRIDHFFQNFLEYIKKPGTVNNYYAKYLSLFSVPEYISIFRVNSLATRINFCEIFFAHQNSSN